jgi:hypothetical protein
MKLLLISLMLTVFSQAIYAHGSSQVDGEWQPVLKTGEKGKVVTQIQSSPLGNEILIAYSGEGRLEVLSEDDTPFIRITKQGVFANWDHPMWFKVQTAGPRPLPEWVKDGNIESKWTQVSNNNYYGWYDQRLVKSDDHSNQWQIGIAVDGERQTIDGYFKSLNPPEKRTLVTLDNSATPIANLSAMIIPGVDSAIRVSYSGDHHMVVLDKQKEPMLRFSPKGVEANTSSTGWKTLGRKPYGTEPNSTKKNWVLLSSHSAYTWQDSRIQSDETGDGWAIPVFCHSDKVVKYIEGGWLEVAKR